MILQKARQQCNVYASLFADNILHHISALIFMQFFTSVTRGVPTLLENLIFWHIWCN